ncbi:hypothetical protein [Acidovorax sp. SUPP3334]|uniref:hypothetical protein n=1 Tax=Acidovorax sp. SUPP3334 TaxID=2920881 RepID=UPI0023DE57FB|nr:hypothetical protein [Acidovorax sp. SUPP3334]GKT25944.1 hypothetical protein AVHM3334_19575 [Acidovorax sp. SUPP3334]
MKASFSRDRTPPAAPSSADGQLTTPLLKSSDRPSAAASSTSSQNGDDALGHLRHGRASRYSSGPHSSNAASPRQGIDKLKSNLGLRSAAIEVIARKKKAQANLAFLASSVPQLVQQRRAETAALMARIAEQTAKDGFRHPQAIKGKVTLNADGDFECKDKAIKAVLRFAAAMHPDLAAGIDLSSASELSLPLETEILLKSRAFASGCEVRELNLADGSSEEVSIDLTTYTTRQAIKKGTQGFQEGATLRAELDAAAEVSQRSETDDIEGGSEHGSAMELADLGHPFAFLQGVRYQVESDNAGLKQLVEKALNAHDPITLELRGRLGAQAIQSVISQKQFSKELGWAMAASMVGSGGLAYALDVLAWGAILSKVSDTWGEEHPATQFATVVLSSLTPLFAETADSLVIKRLLGVFKNEPLLPESLDELMGDLKDSAISGTIAAVGSVPNNAAGLTQRWGMEPVSMLTNQLAVSTSGAMVPQEIAKAHEEMTAGVIQQMSNGFFPTPDMPETTNEPQSSAAARRAFAGQVKADTQSALEVAPGDGLAINSMGIGSVISLLTGFLPFDTMARAHVLPAMVQKVVTIMVNTPTEVLSLGAGILSSNYLGGLGGLLTTDAEKNRRMIELIANKAVERLNASPDPVTKQPASVPITEQELKAIEHPALALTFPAGKGIVQAMNGVVNVLSSTWSAMRGKPSESLSEQVDIQALSAQHPRYAPPEA